jgi:phosphoribosylanthranilate isomerase
MIAGNIQIDDINNFRNKDFIVDLSGALEDQNGKKDINKIDKLLNLFGKYET